MPSQRTRPARVARAAGPPSDPRDRRRPCRDPGQGLCRGEYFRRLNDDVVAGSTRVSSPLMIGHMVRFPGRNGSDSHPETCGLMRPAPARAPLHRGRSAQTTALPYFHRPLAKLVTAMNQNTVKVETASAVTFLERETLAKLHRAFYGMDLPFYESHAHRAESCLGAPPGACRRTPAADGSRFDRRARPGARLACSPVRAQAPSRPVAPWPTSPLCGAHGTRR